MTPPGERRHKVLSKGRKSTDFHATLPVRMCVQIISRNRSSIEQSSHTSGLTVTAVKRALYKHVE
jgi:hypothetical protein